MHQQAYTLIELLVVVIIVGLVAGIGIPPLVRQVDRPSLERAELLLRAADRHGRDLARGEGMQVELSSDGMSHRMTTDETRTFCEPAVTLRWLTPAGKPLDRFALDRHGRSVDLVVELSVGDERRRFTVSGISGEWSREIPEPKPEATTQAGEER